MNEMDMALEMINAIEELSIADFIAEYNRLTGKNVKQEDVEEGWNGFPVYYNPED